MTSSNVDQAVREITEQVVARDAGVTDTDARFPADSMAALGKAGLLGILIPKELGGAGLGPRDFARVTATLSEADASVGMVYVMHVLGAACIAKSPHASEMEPVLREIAAGRHLTTLAFSERGSRSHFWAPVSRATRTGAAGGGGVVLNAEKSFVTSAGKADSYVVTTLSPDGAGPTDTTLYMVPADAAGITVAGEWTGMGLRGNASAPMTFTNVAVADANRLTPDGSGFQAKLETVLPLFSLGSSAVCLGIARAAVNATAAHLKTARLEHMDQTLGEALPNLRAKLAAMQVRTSGLEAQINMLVDSLEAPSDVTVLRVLETKAAANEVAIEVTAAAMRVCGGAAYSKQTSVDRHFRDAHAGAVMAPTVDQLHDFIGKALVGLPLF